MGSSVLVIGAALTYASGADRIDADSLSFPSLRVMAAPVQIVTGQSISSSALTQHLLRIGYSQAAAADVPGTFARADESLALFPRLPEFPSIAIHWSGDTVSSITGVEGEQLHHAEIEPETVMTFEPDGWTQTLQRDTESVSHGWAEPWSADHLTDPRRLPWTIRAPSSFGAPRDRAATTAATRLDRLWCSRGEAITGARQRRNAGTTGAGFPVARRPVVDHVPTSTSA